MTSPAAAASRRAEAGPAPLAGDGPLVYLLDAHLLIFRAYYGMPALEGPEGQSVGAVRGYLSTLVRLLSRRRPAYVAACWDHAFTSFRNRLFPDYKRGRTEAPEDLAPQLPLCARGTRALGIPLFELPDYEADDVIATLVRTLLPCGARIAIVSGDKDLGALVGERVALLDPRQERWLGPDEIRARLGVPPALVPDFLALAGDATDGIPGVKGIGARTAAALLDHFGSLDQVPRDPEAWADVPLRGARGLARRLADAEEELRLSQALVRLVDDLPLGAALEDLAWRGADRTELDALLREIGGLALLERVPRFQS